MKCTIPEISWHNREPVLSIDLFSVENQFYRLATGGSDTFVLIWQLKILEAGSVHVEILSELTRHQKAVNVVKWSPNGQYLASGDDDANVILWQLKTDNVPLLEGENDYKETWISYKILRGHKEDIYDLCWAPDGNQILTGSVDNSAILWDITKGKSEQILTDHKSFVQGVAWDPKDQYLATLCSDRVCRVFGKNGRVKARIVRGLLPLEESHPLHNKEVKYFHDDTFKTFFRRLSFSPDGSFLVVPSGCVETDDCKNAMYGTYLFTLDSLKQPAAILPSQKQCSIVAKCCPIMYELRPKGPKPIIDLPYRMIIAVATDSDVILYDTQQTAPFAHLQKIHYTRLTDLTWSSDGLLLTASSTDGFITFVTFEEDELGTKYVKEESEPEESILNISGCEEIEEKEAESKIKVEAKPKKPSFLEQWAKQGPKRKTEDVGKVSPKKLKTDEVITVEDSPEKPKINRIVPRRVPTKPVELKTPVEIKNPAKQLVNETDPSTQKKRITPIRLGSSKNAEVVSLNNTTEETHTKDIETNNKDIVTNNKDIVTTKETDNATPNKIVTGIKDTAILNKKLTPKSKDIITPNKVGTPKVKDIITPNKVITPKTKDTDMSKPKTPKPVNSANKSSSKKKPVKPTLTPKSSKMSLLQFFKPIPSNSTKQQPPPSSPPKDDLIEIPDDDDEGDKNKAFKVNTCSLLKKTPKSPAVTIAPVEDTMDAPDDFCLQVEETMDVDDPEVSTEKENSVLHDKQLEMIKEPRRIPLITLSSPKNKKKKVDSECM